MLTQVSSGFSKHHIRQLVGFEEWANGWTVKTHVPVNGWAFVLRSITRELISFMSQRIRLVLGIDRRPRNKGLTYETPLCRSIPMSLGLLKQNLAFSSWLSCWQLGDGTKNNQKTQSKQAASPAHCSSNSRSSDPHDRRNPSSPFLLAMPAEWKRSGIALCEYRLQSSQRRSSPA